MHGRVHPENPLKSTQDGHQQPRRCEGRSRRSRGPVQDRRQGGTRVRYGVQQTGGAGEGQARGAASGLVSLKHHSITPRR